jgi:muconolactone D-isomerase
VTSFQGGDSHSRKESIMEFLVEFELDVPSGTPESEVGDRQRAEASAAAELAHDGHLVRVWRASGAGGASKVLGLYRADSPAQLDGLLRALPLYGWMHVAVTALEPHPNDPSATVASDDHSAT